MSGNSCWSCKLHGIGFPDTFLGKCLFPLTKLRPPREIPARIVDVGCPQWRQK